MSHSWQVNENVTFLADGDPTTSSAPVRIHIRNRPEACVLNRHGDDSWWSVDISWDELAEFVLGQLADRKIEEIEGADTWQDRAKALGL